MKKTLTMFFVVLAVFSFSNISNAQFKMKLGPNLGMNFNLHTGSDLTESGNGFGVVIGAGLDMQFTPMIGLITNMQFYDNRSGSTEESGSVQGISYTVDNSISLAYFMIEPLFKLSIPNSGFYFVMGPALGFNLEASQELKITSQNDQVTFQDGSTKQKSTIRETLARFEIKFGAGYDIPLGGITELSPQLSFGYGLSKVRSDVEWRVLTIQALVSAKFRII
ncbi:MAG TPA: outer membrane beta-barrel protein [Ignavibacteriaceae bacterium]|nr:outer membrane beta-barrel protein [Ignavibacteriaceae bacterium]